MKYYSTNNKNEVVNFETAILNGLASNFGLYMMSRQDVPRFTPEEINELTGKPYHEIAFKVVYPYLAGEIAEDELKEILKQAYDETQIPTRIEKVDGAAYILWLTAGPTYAFKDYAARFFGQILNYFLDKRGLKRTIVVATSGDTGGAVGSALKGLKNINCIIFYPANVVSEEQKRQMTTLGDNIYAFEVKGDFDVCQDLAKNILNDKQFAESLSGDPEHITSANSISLGRLIPQIVFPFFAYSRIGENNEEMICSIPSGNFGDMMGSVIASQMGLPIKKIICAVNENKEFPRFLETNEYRVEKSAYSPSTAMIISHPTSLARLFDFYGGHIFDKRDERTGQITKPGVIDQMPNMGEIKKLITSLSINNEEHYETIKNVYKKYNIILDPHGAVGWRALEKYLNNQFNELAVVYETADPAKFPDTIEKATGKKPPVPERIIEQTNLPERIFYLENAPEQNESGFRLSEAQIGEAKEKIKKLLTK